MYHTFKNDKILAITTNRQNGFSKAPFDNFNLAYHVNDKVEDVEKNYDLLCDQLAIDKDQIYLANQTHSDNFSKITKDSAKFTNNTDALYTTTPGIYLGVFTADCLPILCYAKDRKLVAAIHSGWLGSTKLITYKLIAHLISNEKIDISKLEVFIGPSILQENYEVGQDVYDKISSHEFIDAKQCFTKLDNDKYLFDNRLFNTLLLLKLGVLEENITSLDECTLTNNKYFSYRQNKVTGRQLSLIGIKEEQ